MDNINDKEKARYLFEKYMIGDCTEDEKVLLAQLIQRLGDKELADIHQLLWNKFDTKAKLSDEKSIRILKNIYSSTKKPTKYRQGFFSFYTRIISLAACILIAVVVGNHIYKTNTDKPLIAKAMHIPASQAVRFTRQIILPDGSTVILKSGSRLYYPKQFNGSTREVKLEGEAYFDIVHNPSKQFIVHAGKITTTVLGTAFNIIAEGENVKVTVTRGRVKVNDGKRKLAILSINEAIQYRSSGSHTETQNMPAEKNTTDWMKQDMNFDHVSLSDIAQTLSRRYGIDVEITDPELAHRIFVLSFSGTENVSEVMNLLCELMPDISYNTKNNNIAISKKIIKQN